MVRKPTNCWCKGSWKVKSLRWGCLRRDASGSLLYCMDCRQEWLSVRNYAASIPMWKKRTRSGMTDEGILERIAAGSLRVREENGAVIVESVTAKGTKVLKQIDRAVHEYTTYRFVHISLGGRQKKVAVHRLNWMFHNGRVPEGFHVDHEKDRSDTIGNLRLLPASVNCATNCQDQGEPF